MATAERPSSDLSAARAAAPLAVVPLAQALDPRRVGGKAAGLARLLAAGLDVPPGFVVPASAAGPPLPHAALRGAVDAWLAEAGGRDALWAVRSSAVGEDGAHASFAGQLETFLHRRGPGAVAEAIVACVDSGRARRVAAYAHARQEPRRPALGAAACTPGDPGPPVAVLVQRQVDAAWAGVLFTADPVRGLRDRFVLSAVPGLGDALVGGEVDGLDFTIHATGAVLAAPSPEEVARVAARAGRDPDLLRRAIPRLVAQARRAVERLGYPLDMEWAVGAPSGSGSPRVWWLQARPVTTLPAAHPNELDAPWPGPREVLTRGNIGEMMPGPVTPLTASVFGRAVDLGLQDFAAAVGAQGPPDDAAPRYLKSYYAHLFFDMGALYAIPRHVALNTKEDVDLSIVGRPLSREGAASEDEPPRAGRWRRVVNFLRLLAYMRRAPRRADALAALTAELRWEPSLADDLPGTVAWLTRARDVLVTAYAHHYATSALSGSYHAAIMRVLAGGVRTRTPAHHAAAAALLADIEGVESAQVVRGVEALARALAAHPAAAARLDLPPEQLWAWLQTDGPAPLRAELRAFLDAHGHRAVREAELRTRDWHDDPAALVALAQARAQGLASPASASASPASPAPSFDLGAALRALDPALGVTRPGRWVLRHLVPRARAAVAQRERTKSLSIRAQRQVKLGYRALGERLAALGRLPDPDAVFFLTHDELVALVEGAPAAADPAAPTPGALAAARRELMPWLESLRFEDVGRGLPRPLEPTSTPSPGDAGALVGLPVSRGVATGRARVVRTLDDAARLEPGDILVAPMTDVGWTPYFGMVAGLVTEVGSPLSHGAVVAREYGLPAVVSVEGACDALAHEPLVTVDGDAGTVRAAADAGPATSP